MNDYNVTNYDNDEIIIDIKDVLKDTVSCVRRFWLIMLVICAAAILAGGIWKKVSYQPVYEAATAFTITLRDTANNSLYEYTYNTSTENALEKHLDGIVASTMYREMIAEELEVDELDEQLTLSSVSGTNQFRLAVKGTDPESVMQVMESAITYFPKAAADTVGWNRLNVKQETGEITGPSNAPEMKKGILYGAAAGIAVCFVIIFVFVFRRLNCVHKEADLKELLGIRSYGKIVREVPDTVRSAALRLQKDMDAQQKKVILIEGCVSDSDNAKVAFGLAQMLAMSGKRVLLADCNLVSPNYGEWMKDTHCSNCFSRFLSGGSDLQSCICHLKEEAIDLIGNDEPVADFSRQISMDSFGTFIETAKKQYDYVVLAAPGAKSLCGKAAAAEHADGVVYVVNKGTVNAKVICETIAKLTDRKSTFMGGIFLQES